MRADEILTLFNYNYWANERVLHAASQINHEQFLSDQGLSHGSLRDTLAHILGAEWIWRVRIQEGISPNAILSSQGFPHVQALSRFWSMEERAMRSFLDTLNSRDLKKVVRYSTTTGAPHENLLWHLLVHVVNHGTQFRSEAAVALTHLGYSPGDLDFIAYLRIGNDQ